MSEQEKRWEEEFEKYWQENYGQVFQKTDNFIGKWYAKQSYLQACKARQEEIERLKEFIWLNHDCPIGGLYGDDGEKQCNNMAMHRPIDFKRDSVDTIITKLRPEKAKVEEAIKKYFQEREAK